MRRQYLKEIVTKETLQLRRQEQKKVLDEYKEDLNN